MRKLLADTLVVSLEQAVAAPFCTSRLACLLRMLAGADVFVQNFSPGATDRLGLGSDSLRERFPQLITCDRFCANTRRCEHRAALEATISSVLETLPAAEIRARLVAAKVAFGSVNSISEFSRHPQLQRATVGFARARNPTAGCVETRIQTRQGVQF